MKIEDEIKQKAFKNEYQKAMINIIFTSGWLEHKQTQFFKQWHISPQQYNVLRILRGQNNNPITIASIQERMMDKMSNASRLVEKLKQKNLIDRKECKTDRRQVDIIITQKGLNLLSDIDNQMNTLEQIIKNISDDEAIELNRILDKLRG
ncbi:MAG: MarR family winged helix-turn-helix transcriptional regulator [Bacteroidia bacterium]